MSREIVKTYYVESGDLTERVLASSVEEACQLAIKQGNPLSLGLLMRISERGFMNDERDRNPHFIKTEVVLDDMGWLLDEERR